MKIGLLTFHDTNNFGSYLQTYGLYKKVVDLGYDCEVVDYQCRSLVERELPKPYKLSLNPRSILKELIVDRVIRNKYHQLLGFLHDNMNLSERYDRSSIKGACSHFDKFLVGSDIVWGMDIIGNDTAFFLDFEKDSNKKLAFSSSVGNPWSQQDKIIIEPYLKEFNGIAVREEESADWVQELTGRRPQVVCDPTMLLEANEWASFRSDKYSNKKYILVYFPTEANLKAAKELAKKENCECWLISHGLPVKGFKTVKPLNMPDFLALFYNAHFVVTASYHGMLFSIYFNKQFAYFNRAHKSRMNTLARKLKVTDREGSEYNVLQMEPVNYDEVNAAVEEYRNYSINCLKELLSK